MTLFIEKSTPAPSPVVDTTAFKAPSRAYFSTIPARLNAVSPLWWYATRLFKSLESLLPAADSISRGSFKKSRQGSSAARDSAIDSASRLFGAKIKSGHMSDSAALCTTVGQNPLTPRADISGSAATQTSSIGTARSSWRTRRASRPSRPSHSTTDSGFATLPLINKRRHSEGSAATAVS